MSNALASSFYLAPEKQPGYLLWTRMQAEAGQGLELILKRKERERLAGDGRFFWGVGNAPAVTIKALARTKADIPVVFSRMKTKPKSIDQNPSSIVVWSQYIDYEGRVRPLPPNALVTSRGESFTGKKRFHYALECFSSKPLEINEEAAHFDPAAFRNASGTGAPVGASQVTSLLVHSAEQRGERESGYTVDMTAALVGSYWVKLVDPLLVPQSALGLINQVDSGLGNWLEIVEELRLRASFYLKNDSFPLFQ